MANTRSPKYPITDLRDAVNRTEMIYSKERTHPASSEVVVNAMGYTSLNGASRRMLATLERYSLLESIEEGYKVSDNALAILRNSPGHFERLEALKSSFQSAKIFAELSERYGESLPSDRNIESFLTLEGYTTDAAKKVVSVFRSSKDFVNEERGLHEELQREADTPPNKPNEAAAESVGGQSNSTAQDTIKNPNNPEGQHQGDTDTRMGLNREDGWGKPLRFPISEDVEFQGSFRGPVTQEAVQTLIAFLEVFKITVPKRLERGEHDGNQRIISETFES